MPSPATCAVGSSARELRASPKTPLATRPSLSSSGLPWGCSPSSRHQPASSLRRSSRSAAAPSAPFLTASTTSAASLRGSISPRCHVQGSPYRGLLFRHSLSRLVAGPFPLVGWPPSPARVAPCASFDGPALRALFRGGARGVDLGVTRCRRSIPSWASPPPGSPSPHRRERLHALFRSWPCDVDCRSILRRGLQRVAGSEPDASLSRRADLREVCCLPHCCALVEWMQRAGSRDAVLGRVRHDSRGYSFRHNHL
jgi:hypothetical protein